MCTVPLHGKYYTLNKPLKTLYNRDVQPVYQYTGIPLTVHNQIKGPFFLYLATEKTFIFLPMGHFGEVFCHHCNVQLALVFFFFFDIH